MILGGFLGGSGGVLGGLQVPLDYETLSLLGAGFDPNNESNPKVTQKRLLAHRLGSAADG